jgi:integrase
VKGVRRIGVRLWNWLTPEQGRRLLERPTPPTSRELRDHAMLAMLIGCGLRRAELLGLRLESIQQREEHWVIADLVGKAGHVRTVPIPMWVKAAVDTWTAAAAITDGSLFRAINQGRAHLGRRHVAEGPVGRRPRGGGSRRHRQAGAARSATSCRLASYAGFRDARAHISRVRTSMTACQPA